MRIMKEAHDFAHLLPQHEPGIGPEGFTPSAAGLICGVSARAWPMLRRNSLLDKHEGLKYSMHVNDKVAKLRLT